MKFHIKNMQRCITAGVDKINKRQMKQEEEQLFSVVISQNIFLKYSKKHKCFKYFQ